MVAFGQHYAVNWVRWEGDPRNPWTNWEAICANDFGNASSPSQAFFANPLAVVHHMFQNLSNFPRGVASMYGRSYPGNRPARIALAFGITLLTAAALARIRRGALSVLRKRIRDNLRSGWLALTLLFIAALPVVISILLIAPRHHYLYMLGTLSVIGVAILFFRKPGNVSNEHSSYAVVVLLCIAVLMITRPLSVLLPVHHQPTLKTITCLRDMNLATHVNLLEAEGGYGIYLGDNYTRVAEYAKDRPFLDFLVQRSINMIVVSPGLAGDLRFRNDPQWHSFSNSPESFGFTRVSIPGVDERERSLLVKREIIGSTAIPE